MTVWTKVAEVPTKMRRIGSRITEEIKITITCGRHVIRGRVGRCSRGRGCGRVSDERRLSWAVWEVRKGRGETLGGH